MNAHKLNAVLSQDGQLLLNGLPFRAGDKVEVIVLAQKVMNAASSEDSLDSLSSSTTGASDQIYLAGISGMMEEWESETDEAAYQNL
jgi:hypothetical protein